MKSRKITSWLLLGTLACSAAIAGDKGFSPPPAKHAATYALHESHDDESVSIALDPYDTPEKTAIFKVRYRDSGLMPIRLIVSNDSDKPLMLDDLKVVLVTGTRVRLQPATKEDIYRRISRPEKSISKPTVKIPIPGTGKRPTSISQEAFEEVGSAIFVTVPVTPHATNSGFLFFDVIDVERPEAGAHLYISGVRAGTKELFYFDIPLQNADPTK